MNIKIIDQPFLLSAYSLDSESRIKTYPTILIDRRLGGAIFVMVKGFKLTSNNKYEITT
jgi:hypothetical protein